MKKIKGFNVGDQVFAKVKGYPAWPAVITEAHNTKYSVKFYGTGETGSVKPKDIFYYLKHKHTFVKSLKRKDYNEAIEEIERAINEAGTDGNNEQDTTLDLTLTSNSSINDSIASNNSKIGKRKRSSSVSSEKVNDVQAKKKVSRSSTPANNSISSVQDSEINEENVTPETNQNDKVILENDSSNAIATDSNESTETSKLLPDNEKNKPLTDTSVNLQDMTESQTSEIDQDLDKENKVTITSAKRDKVPVLTVADVKIVADDYLQALIAYADHVKKNEDMYKKKPAEKRSWSKNEIVIAKLPEGKYVGIKYNREDPPPMKNEYEYAEYDESEAKTILSLKTVVEQGSCKPEDDPNLFVTNLNIDELQLHDTIQMELIERKKVKLKWLRVESNLIELDTKIKACLGLDKANPEAALEHLNIMAQLEIDPLMLKKHPHVVDMIKRLRRYIGNVKEWNMTHDERAQFEADAEKVKDISNDVYLKFAKLFNIVDPMIFWDVFAEEVKEFQHQIKDMQEGQVFALTSEPNSRQAFLDGIDEKEEMEVIATKIDNTDDKAHKAEKENSSKIANTDDNQGVGIAIDKSTSTS